MYRDLPVPRPSYWVRRRYEERRRERLAQWEEHGAAGAEVGLAEERPPATHAGTVLDALDELDVLDTGSQARQSTH